MYHCQYGPNDNALHIPVVTKDMYQKKRKLDSKVKYIPNGKVTQVLAHPRGCEDLASERGANAVFL
jgi:hypothetical protein